MNGEQTLDDTGADLRQRRRIDVRFFAWLGSRDTPPAAEWRRLFKVAPFSAVGLVAVSPIACATAPPLVWLAGALDVSVWFFVYSRDGCYELLAV